MSISQSYCGQIHKHFKVLRANWPVNSPIQLGDFGYLTNGIFRRKSNVLPAFGIKTALIESPGQSHYFFTSGKSVDVQIQARGSVSDPLSVSSAGSISVRFSQENGVYFNAAGCVVREIAEQIAFGRKIIDLFGKGVWIDDWFVVTSLVASGSTTILISGAAGADVVLDANVETSALDIADSKLRLGLRSQKSMGFTAVTQHGIVPFIGLSKVRRRFLGGRKLAMSASKPSETLEFRRLLLEQNEPITDHFEFGRDDEPAPE